MRMRDREIEVRVEEEGKEVEGNSGEVLEEREHIVRKVQMWQCGNMRYVM